MLASSPCQWSTVWLHHYLVISLSVSAQQIDYIIILSYLSVSGHQCDYIIILPYLSLSVLNGMTISLSCHTSVCQWSTVWLHHYLVISLYLSVVNSVTISLSCHTCLSVVNSVTTSFSCHISLCQCSTAWLYHYLVISVCQWLTVWLHHHLVISLSVGAQQLDYISCHTCLSVVNSGTTSLSCHNSVHQWS